MESINFNLDNIIIKNIKNTKLNSVSNAKNFFNIEKYPTSLEEVKDYISKNKEDVFCYYLINDERMICDFIRFQASFGTAESFKYALEYYQENIDSIEARTYSLIKENLTEKSNSLKHKNIVLNLPFNNYLEIIFKEIIKVDSIEKMLAFASVNGFNKCDYNFIVNSILKNKKSKISKEVLKIEDVKKYIYENTEKILKTYHKNSAMSTLNQQFIMDNIIYFKNEGVANFIKDGLLDLYKIFSNDIVGIAVLTYFDNTFKNYEKSKDLLKNFYNFINFLKHERIIDFKTLPEYIPLINDLKKIVPENLNTYIDYLELSSDLINVKNSQDNPKDDIIKLHKKVKI